MVWYSVLLWLSVVTSVPVNGGDVIPRTWEDHKIDVAAKIGVIGSKKNYSSEKQIKLVKDFLAISKNLDSTLREELISVIVCSV